MNKPHTLVETVSSLILALALALTATTAFAGDKVKLKNITCEQYLAMDEDERDNIVYWIEGAAIASDKKSVAAEDIEVGYDMWGRPVAEVDTACMADKKASLWSKVKSKF